MTTDREELKRRVEALGGLPVIFKVPGKSLGVGVVRVDNWPTFILLLMRLKAHTASTFT